MPTQRKKQQKQPPQLPQSESDNFPIESDNLINTPSDSDNLKDVQKVSDNLTSTEDYKSDNLHTEDAIILDEDEFERLEDASKDDESEDIIDSDNLEPEDANIPQEGEDIEEEEDGDDEEDNDRDEEGRYEVVDEGGYDDESDKSDSDKGPPKRSVLQEINEERKIQRKLSSIAFLVEYAKGPYRSYQTVAQKLHIGERSAYSYLKDFVNLVKHAVENQSYPDSVLRYYNDVDIDNDKRLKFHHLDHLKEVVLKYSNYDVTKRLNTSQTDNLISKNKVTLEHDEDYSILDNVSREESSFTSTTPPPTNRNEFNDIYTLAYGITPYQLLRYGLLNIYDQNIRNKASAIIGPDPTEYFASEKKLKDLLLMLNRNEHQAERFIEWLKSAAKYVAHPIGFLANPFPNHPMNAYGVSNGTPYMNGHGGQNGNNGQVDPMDEFYYTTNVYIRGFPPSHPANQKRLQEHLEREREEREAKNMDKRFAMMFKYKMMDFLDKPQGGNGAGGGLNSLFSPETMLLLGHAEMRQSTDENGNPVVRIVPKIGGVSGMNGQPVGGMTGGPMDQMNVMMQTMKSMMEMVSGMQRQNQDPNSQNFTNQMLQIMLTKAFESPSNKIDEIMQMTTLLEKIRGPASSPISGVGGVVNPYANAPPEVLKELKQMELDKEFATMQMQMQREKMQQEAQRAAQADKDAAENTDKIINAIQGVAPTLLAFINQFMQGNKAAQNQGQPGMMQDPNSGLSPQEMALRMHFEQQKRAAEEEKRRREEQWRASQVQPTPTMYQPPPPVSHPVQTPVVQEETKKVVIEERPQSVGGYSRTVDEHHHHIQEEEPENFTEADFMKYPITELQRNLKLAEKEEIKLESYKAAIATAIQNKLLNGGDNIVEQYRKEHAIIREQPTQKKVIVEEEEDIDLGQVLDESKKKYDPDYDGMTDTQEKEGTEEVITETDKSMQDEETEIVEIDDTDSIEDT